MANEIQAKFDSEGSFTITLGSLANGSGRSSASVDNSTNQRPAAMVSFAIKAGTAPTSGRVYEVYLLRDLGTVASDNWGGTDAAITPRNAYCLGSIEVDPTLNATVYKEFSTHVAGPLGPTWGIAIVNNSGQTLNASGHSAKYRYYIPEIQ